MSARHSPFHHHRYPDHRPHGAAGPTPRRPRPRRRADARRSRPRAWLGVWLGVWLGRPGRARAH
ncbi:hypothetical protein CWI85_17180, partial [Streptomyces albidoflavus]